MDGRVVVGVDGSAGARAALLQALAEASRRGAELEVVSAAPVRLPWTGTAPIVVPDVDDVLADTGSRAEAFLREVLAEATPRIPGAGDVRTRVVTAPGPAAQALVDRSDGAQLLVVGNRGRGALRSALLGSVALHVVTHARCPVMVVHEPPDDTRPPAVLVGVDGSAASAVACRVAVAEAVRRGARVDVLTAWSPIDFWPDLYDVVGPSGDDVQSWVGERVEAVVSDVRAWAAAEYGAAAPLVKVEVAEGHPADLLVHRAAGAALLVVGCRGHGSVRGLLLGSIALHVAVHAPCPVLVVHPEAARSGINGSG